MVEKFEQFTPSPEEEKKSQFERGYILEFIEELEERINQEIKDIEDIHTQSGGALAGTVRLGDGRRLPFQGDKLLEEIGGERIKDVRGIHTQPDGALAGKVELEDGRWLPFQGDKLLEEIGGKKIKSSPYMRIQPDGTLTGKVQLEDDRIINFFWDGTRVIYREF